MQVRFLLEVQKNALVVQWIERKSSELIIVGSSPTKGTIAPVVQWIECVATDHMMRVRLLPGVLTNFSYYL